MRKRTRVHVQSSITIQDQVSIPEAVGTRQMEKYTQTDYGTKEIPTVHSASRVELIHII